MNRKVLVLGVGRINIVKLAKPAKAIHSFNEIPIKILKSIFIEINNPKICMESQKIPIVKETLQKNSKAGGIHTF